MSPPSRPRIVVHIGEPKTGTTFLQQIMWRNRGPLAKQGLLLPGPRPMAHWRAAQDLREVVQIPNDPAGSFAGTWRALAAKALTATRVGVISHELIAAANDAQAARAVRSLAGGDVHVAITVRDMAGLLPAEWQETVKHRNTREWPAWLADVIDRESSDPDRQQFWFWRVHDTLAILRRWSRVVPPDHLHVVTVPPRGAPTDLIWRRFATVLDIDPDVVDLSRARGNASLGVAEVEMLRRLNIILPREVPNWYYMAEVKDALAHDALTHGHDTRRLGLPPDRFAWAKAHSDEVVSKLRDSPYHIVGDLDDLVPSPDEGPQLEPSGVDSDELFAAACTALSAVVTRGAIVAQRPKPAPSLKAALVASADRRRTADYVLRAFRYTRDKVRAG